jgi:hypothetical protein
MNQDNCNRIPDFSAPPSTPKRAPKEVRADMFRRGFVEATNGNFVRLAKTTLIKPNHPTPGQAECIDRHGNLIGRVHWPLEGEGA